MKSRLLTVFISSVMIIVMVSTMAFANNYVAVVDDESNDLEPSFKVSDICGGKRIVDGKEQEMTKEEAQQEYLKDINLHNNPEVNTDSSIMPRVVVSTKIKTHKVTTGANKRITPIYYNKTSSPITQEATGSETWTASLTAGIEADKVVNAINSSLNVQVSYSKTKSVKTTVTIKPGEKFYVTFTPKYVKVTGSQIISLHGGAATSKEFSGTFPKTVSGQYDGNIYYITEKI